MTLKDMMATLRNCDAPQDSVDAQKQWLETGTVSDEYVRSEVAGSFSNRTPIEDMVRDALTQEPRAAESENE